MRICFRNRENGGSLFFTSRTSAVAFLLRTTGCFVSIKEKKNPSTVLQHGQGIRFFVHMDSLLLLPTGIIACADFDCNMLFVKVVDYI